MINPRRCPHCLTLVTGPCPCTGRVVGPDGKRPSSTARGYGHAHRTRRAAMLADPGARCAYPGCMRTDLVRDHRVPQAAGTGDPRDQLLCALHNARKAQADAVEAARINSERARRRMSGNTPPQPTPAVPRPTPAQPAEQRALDEAARRDGPGGDVQRR